MFSVEESNFEKANFLVKGGVVEGNHIMEYKLEKYSGQNMKIMNKINIGLMVIYEQVPEKKGK